ncbi:pyridoxal phosphate-dependent aminotransferase [Henriciella aquimarina]|uniref:pyridoxal phosphate-dependent aminotransferase n=1 Tax=Henriciella aquimarina TaxID=545261 RepID=UPI0009FF2A9E|nr:histidinol-phosphate transaminase [Henriciella aquimarina]
MKPLLFSPSESLCASRRDILRLAGAGSAGLATLAATGCTGEAAPKAEAQTAATAASSIAILSSNENPFGPFPKAMEAMKAEVAGVNRYSYGSLIGFGEKVAELEGVAPEEVLVTNGSSPILGLFGMWAAKQEGALLTSMATYEAVPRTTEHFGGEVIYTPLDSEMGIDLDAMAERMGPDISSVYICNPNNPTGRTVDAAKLKSFAEEASKTAMVFIDEAYLEMSDDYPNNTMKSLVSDGKNVIVCRTFSKLYGLAGQRLGYAVMPAEMVTWMRQSGQLSSVNHLGLIAGTASLEDSAGFDEMRAKNIRGREKLIAMAADLGRPIAPKPQGSFIYMDTGMDHAVFAEEMAKLNVRVVGRTWPGYDSWTRLCVGFDREIEACHEAARVVLSKA